MAKIKLENDNIVVYYSELGNGLYDTVKNFKINLTEKTHFFVKNDTEQQIEWNFNEDDEMTMIENLKKELKFKIENNYIVINSYRLKSDHQQIEKNEKHLEKNKKILVFLENYKIS